MIGQKTIFIIDDHPDSLRAMCLALAGETYRLETADSAASATRKLSSIHPDLTLLDTRIPAADGTRLARRLLVDEELSSVPIVALIEMSTGTLHHPESEARFDGKIGKPIETGAFQGQIRAFLDSPRLASSNPPADPGTWTGLYRLAGVLAGLQDQELADYLQQAERLSNATTARARSRLQLVIRACRELVQREADVAPGLAELRFGYLDHRRAESSELDRALKDRDFVALRKAGHNLKGTGAAYGFAELTDIGRALEAAANDDNAAAAEALLDQIESYISIVRPSPEQRGDHAGI